MQPPGSSVTSDPCQGHESPRVPPEHSTKLPLSFWGVPENTYFLEESFKPLSSVLWDSARPVIQMNETFQDSLYCQQTYIYSHWNN
jgi:hypothetical protein